MRILHITNNFPTTKHPIFGIFIKEQIDSLALLGLENEVYFINTREKGKKEYLRACMGLHRHVRSKNYDIIHCHHSYSAFITLVSGILFSRKRVLSYQSDPVNESGLLLFKILYRYFNLIILKNRSPEITLAKTVYLPNGVNMDVFMPRDRGICKHQLGLSPVKRYILFMDSYDRRPFKRIDRFNSTLEILKEKYDIQNIEPLILTNTERSLVPLYICASELHLLTSDFEGSPNSVKECLSCNIPVVSTPVGNVSDLLGDIQGCYVSKSFSPEELADLAFKALETRNGSFRESITDKGLDMQTVANRILNLYQNLINTD